MAGIGWKVVSAPSPSCSGCPTHRHPDGCCDSKGNQEKTQQAIARLLGPEVAVRSYALGSANARMTPLAIGLMGGFVLVFIAPALLSGRLLLPGFLLIYLLVRGFKPYRGVAVTSVGVVLFHCSPWSGSWAQRRSACCCHPTLNHP